jgi:Nucleotidyl transferase AbiEii toxin, Type IV TA system
LRVDPVAGTIATVTARLPEAEDFALAGGAALIVHGAVGRVTRDLDFFGPAAHSVDVLAPAAERALLAEGFSVERVLDNPGFVRLVVVGDDDRTEVDLGSDARIFPLDQGPGFQLLSTEELAVDKVLAVFGRAEARDFMDLQSVEARFGLDRLLALAAD